nr:hypothetical protein [Tanacetum cinerariifolium]
MMRRVAKKKTEPFYLANPTYYDNAIALMTSPDRASLTIKEVIDATGGFYFYRPEMAAVFANMEANDEVLNLRAVVPRELCVVRCFATVKVLPSVAQPALSISHFSPHLELISYAFRGASYGTMIESSNHTKAPSYPFVVGDVKFCIISDGTLNLGSPEKVFLGEAKENVEEALTRNFLPKEQIIVDQNILFFSLGNTNVLVETGVGSFTGFGEDAGKLVDNLAAAGIEPARIDAILCSHPHPDHVGGLCNAYGQPTFP